MPQALASGKAPWMRRACDRSCDPRIFRKAEWAAATVERGLFTQSGRVTPDLPGGHAVPRRGCTTTGELGGATGSETCYIAGMSKPKQPGTKIKKKGFVIGRASFGKISAVEGIRLTPAMEKRAADAERKGLSAEEYRQVIVRSYRKP